MYDVYERNLAGGLVDTVSKLVVSNMYVEEVLDTVKDRLLGVLLRSYRNLLVSKLYLCKYIHLMLIN